MKTKAYARGFIQRYSQSEYKEPVFLPEIMITRNEKFDRKTEKEDTYLKVYPNPAKDFISIEYKLNDEIAKSVLKIVSVNGQLVKYLELTNSQDIIIFEIKDFTPGSYFVYLENNGKKTDSVVITVTK
ncbi:MAG TPA: T9SS type A sorting domain-containing protein [Bacteroidales bacterium]|nr:T9SS type A sorting domain-containing protein [Bacteroidales bacterium]